MLWIPKLCRIGLSLGAIFAGLTGCYSSVQAPKPGDETQVLLSLSETSSVVLLSNSTAQSDLLCLASNQIRIRVSAKSGERPSCREISSLKSDVKKGQTCAGGVNVVDFASSPSWVDCDALTICGVGAASKQLLYQSNAGGKVTELIFQNLPWGCDVKVEWAINQDQRANPDVAFSSFVAVPTCKFCEDTGTTSCLACSAIPSGSELKYGYVIKKCEPGACRSCTVGSTSLAHGEGVRMYSSGTGQACSQTCEKSSAMRVCNDGVLVGNTLFSQFTCLDRLCSCRHPVNNIDYSSGQKAKTFRTKAPTCPEKCEAREAECRNGSWYDVGGSVSIPTADLATYTQLTCTEPVCDCPRAGRATTQNNTTSPVYNVNSVQCGESCDTPAIKGAVSCKNGVLSGNVSSYNYDVCAPRSCGCALPGGGFLSLGNYGYLYKINSTSCSARDACSGADNSLYVRCDSTTSRLIKVSDSTPVDLTVWAYNSCAIPRCNCNYMGNLISFGQTVDVFSKEEVGSSERCTDFKGAVTCSSAGILSGNTDSSVFKYFECRQAGQAGGGGGSGGGTGNGEGDGEIFLRRGGGGGGPGPCEGPPDVCYNHYMFIDAEPPGACPLPWGGSMGPVNRGVITAFSQSCVVKPAKCSSFSQVRYCQVPKWTGSDEFNLPACEEKDSCP